MGQGHQQEPRAGEQRKGPRINLDAVFRAHQREIFLYLARATGDPATAEDLAQESFLRAFQAAATFRGDASVRTWLFAIARNVLSDYYGRQRPRPQPTAEAANVRDPALRLSVQQSLARLPLPAREALVLCDLLQFQPVEAAELVGITANAFRVRLHRAREQFRKVHGHATH